MTRLDRTRSVVRAGAFGISAALLGAAASAALVIGTGAYDTGVTYALLGLIVAVAVGVARPAIRAGWMQALSLVLTLVGLLLSQYVIARHFSGLSDAPLFLPLHETMTLLHDQFAANLIVLVCAGFALLTAATAPAHIEPALSRRQWIYGPAGWLTATAAAVTGLVTLALLTGARLGATNPTRGPTAASRGTAAITSTIDVDFDQVKAGDCYNNPPTDSPDTLPEVPCQHPHDAQVFFVFTMAAGAYPGDDAVDASADHTCGDRFAALDDQLTGPLDYTYFIPSSDAWEAGSRTTQCAAARTGVDYLPAAFAFDELPYGSFPACLRRQRPDRRRLERHICRGDSLTLAEVATTSIWCQPLATRQDLAAHPRDRFKGSSRQSIAPTASGESRAGARSRRS